MSVVCLVEASDYGEAREKASHTIREVLSKGAPAEVGIQFVADLNHAEPQRRDNAEEIARLRRRLNGCQMQIRALVRACETLPVDDPEYVEGTREDFMAAMAHHPTSDIRKGLAMLLGDLPLPLQPTM